MADLPTVADRLNDTEITANAPLTETLMRRIGSNINFLLDFLGVTDGETTPSGALNDLAQAVELANTHTMDLQLSLPTGLLNGVYNIGNGITNEKFLNQHFYLVFEGPAIFSAFSWGGTQNLTFGADGGGAVKLSDAKQGQIGGAVVDTTLLQGSQDAYINSDDFLLKRFSKMVNTADNITIGTLAGGERVILPIGIIDYRDSTTDFDLNIVFSGYTAATSIGVYREYRLNAGSAGF